MYTFSLIAFVFCIDDNALDLGFRLLLAFFFRLADFIVLNIALLSVVSRRTFSVLNTLYRLLFRRRFSILLDGLFLCFCLLRHAGWRGLRDHMFLVAYPFLQRLSDSFQQLLCVRLLNFNLVFF